MTTKSLSLWLFVSLLVGAALGAYLAVLWKDRELESKVGEAVRVEQDRQAPLREERDALQRALDRERLKVEAAAIAVEVERKNFGLARERLTQLGEALQGMAAEAGSRSGAIAEILVRQEEILADLEALDPQAAPKLQQLFADLQAALGDG